MKQISLLQNKFQIHNAFAILSLYVSSNVLRSFKRIPQTPPARISAAATTVMAVYETFHTGWHAVLTIAVVQCCFHRTHYTFCYCPCNSAWTEKLIEIVKYPIL